MVNKKNLYQDVVDLVREKIFFYDVKPESHLFNDLGADSLDLWELEIALEEKFDIEFTKEEILNSLVVRDLVSLVRRKLEEKEKQL